MLTRFIDCSHSWLLVLIFDKMDRSHGTELRRRRSRGNMSKQSVDQPLATATVAALATATGLSASVFNPSGAKVGVSNDASGLKSSVLNSSGLAAGQEPPAAGMDRSPSGAKLLAETSLAGRGRESHQQGFHGVL